MNGTMGRRAFMKASALGAAALASAVHAETAKPRNIVFILIDDMRFDSMGFMGHPFLETPHLDSLAKNGMVFERSYVTTALCSPSRATILTGVYAHSHGVFDNSTQLDDTLATFPRLLQGAGYRTGFIGKWHMGGESDAPRPGFDYWSSFRGQGVYVNPTFNINGEQQKTEGYVTDLITDQAVDFLRAPKDKPFFLYVSHKAVHAEFRPADRHKGCYADKTYPHPASMANTDENYRGKPTWVREQRMSWHGVDGMYDKKVDFDQFARDYAETMRAVDDSVGRIVETLREQGLLESTLLLFTSDNGFQFGEHGLIDKRTMYEPSIRVPLIAHCPELVKAGARCSELTSTIDFAPTFLEMANVAVPESMQGSSLAPLLRGEKPAWRDAVLYEYFWERSFPQTPTVLGVRTRTHKFMRYHGIWDRYELYNIDEDPDEMNNLLGAFMVETKGGTLDNVIRNTAPDDIKKLFNEMSQQLDRLLEETGANREPSWKKE
ncbi:MAG TPA: sulfatase [Candidatus Hydrogenedentes bacterium]|nr:sulfatase [Candidatus Hydrogenedentota bacterium]